MGLPTPTGTVLYYKSGSGDWTPFGCVSSIDYRETTKSTETDLINNASANWSGTTVTSKTRTLEVSGLFRMTNSAGGAIPGAVYTGDTLGITPSNGAGTQSPLDVGSVVKLILQVPVSSGDDDYTFIRFTRDDAQVTQNGSNEIDWVVTDRQISFNGSNPVTYTITFAIDAGSLC